MRVCLALLVCAATLVVQATVEEAEVATLDDKGEHTELPVDKKHPLGVDQPCEVTPSAGASTGRAPCGQVDKAEARLKQAEKTPAAKASPKPAAKKPSAAQPKPAGTKAAPAKEAKAGKAQNYDAVEGTKDGEPPKQKADKQPKKNKAGEVAVDKKHTLGKNNEFKKLLQLGR